MSYVPPVTGVTFSGGDPVEQAEEVEELSKWCHENDLQTTLYTGYKIEELDDKIDKSLFDYIVDGEFEKDKRCYDTPFRGSSNQRFWKNVNGKFCL